MLVASVSVSGFAPGPVWFQLLRRGVTEAPLSIPVNVEEYGLEWNPGKDSRGREFRGRLAALDLPPGDYEFGRWVMNIGTATFVSLGRLGPSVTIGAGDVLYVGNIHVDIQRSSGAYLPARIRVFDASARDLAILKRNYPKLADANIRVLAEEIDREDEEEAKKQHRFGIQMEQLDDLLPPR